MLSVTPAPQPHGLGGLATRVDPDERWLLAEMLREAERVVDRILRITEEQDDKSEQAIALAVATLGGGLALATFGVTRGQVGAVALAALALAAALNLAALRQLIDAYLGLASGVSLQLGPHPGWLAERSNDAQWTIESHVAAVLKAHERDIRTNLAALERVARRRRVGLKLVLWALGFDVVGACLILGGNLVP